MTFLVECKKRSLIPLGLRVKIWKICLCSVFVWLLVLPRWRERLRTIVVLRVVKEIEMSLDWFICAFIVKHLSDVCGSDHMVHVSFRQCIFQFLPKVQIMQYIRSVEEHMN